MVLRGLMLLRRWSVDWWTLTIFGVVAIVVVGGGIWFSHITGGAMSPNQDERFADVVWDDEQEALADAQDDAIDQRADAAWDVLTDGVA